MDSHGHTLFHTALGTCGIAWGPAGITAVQLPEQDPEATRARLLKGLPPLPEVRAKCVAVVDDLHTARRLLEAAI